MAMAASQTGRRRRYVTVRCEIDASGKVTPLSIIWALDVEYRIRSIKVDESYPCLGTGRGRHYLVWIGGHSADLYWDTRRWYVFEKLRQPGRGADYNPRDWGDTAAGGR